MLISLRNKLLKGKVVCTICDELFNGKSTLREHIVREHKCETCGENLIV